MKTATSFQAILRNLESAPALKPLLEAVRQSDTPSEPHHIKHLFGSLPAAVAALLWQTRQEAHTLVIAPDDESGEALRNDLASLIGAENVLWYAESDKKLALDAEQLDTQLIGVTGALTALIGMTHACIVAPAHALLFPVPAPKEFSQNVLTLRRGEARKFDDFVFTLTSSGFDRKDFVETTGDIAVRGGIVDVFPPGMENPIRIEFFGDEIDSLREFDPLSQRSIKEVQEIALVSHLFHNDEHHIAATLLDYLPSSTLTLHWQPEAIQSMLHDLLSSDNHSYDVSEESLERLHSSLRKLPTVLMNGLENNDATIVMDAVAQPNFQSSIANLTVEIRRLIARGYAVFVSSEGQGQMKRVKDLLESALEGNFGSTVESPMLPLSKRGKAQTPDISLKEGEQDALADTDETLQKLVLMPLSLTEGFICHETKIAVFTEHQVFMRRKAEKQASERARGVKSSPKGISMKELQQLKRGDYVVHSDKGIAQFDGLETITVGGGEQESVRLLFAGGDKMYVHLNYINRLQKYSAEEGNAPVLTKLGTGEWSKKKEKTKKRLKDIARDLIKLYAERKMQSGFAFPSDSLWQKEMEASFMYEDTPDQATATSDVKEDMMSGMPMDRLICGDVGFGKTEVAIRAAFKAVQAGKQVAVLVPTTILAEQHFSSFRDRLQRYAVLCDCLSRFRATGEQKEILSRVESGSVDILIGTHRILSKDVKFKDLGLLIVDEEHRFGVAAKEKLRQMRVSIDTLTLTATPIPRTLNFSLMGARDVSVINTPPRNRLPVKTEITMWNAKVLRTALERELARGGQLFVVNDRIGNLPTIADNLRELVPTLRIAYAHGQMTPEELEKQMEMFLERRADALLATKIIESGIDIPNANTMIIFNADNFGLAELYQLRGRVGRSNTQAYCYLLIPPPQTLTRQALKRLQAMEEFSELGSGFNLAMRDLEIRGAGNLLGAEQSGFISDIGFELYQKILDEAVQELKTSEFADVFAPEKQMHRRTNALGEVEKITLPKNDDVTVDIDGDAMIPKNYISNEVERYEFYKKLFRSGTMQEVEATTSELRDRFGALPEAALRLVDAVHLRIAALETGFGHVSFKGGILICEFPPEEKVRFYETVFQPMITALTGMKSVQILPKGKKVLVQSRVGSLEAALMLLRQIIEATKAQLMANVESA
ncbi:MAG: transcription-repair coupling factor [Candidatus Kapaibacterium sp.]|nr:MAG: transcription-repair coupling factor [Candidatus Kapabacteria bacterium]